MIAAIFFLDNMPIKEIKKCLVLRQKTGKKIIFEISGGINLKNIVQYSKLELTLFPQVR